MQSPATQVFITATIYIYGHLKKILSFNMKRRYAAETTFGPQHAVSMQLYLQPSASFHGPTLNFSLTPIADNSTSRYFNTPGTATTAMSSPP
jgi:hypothetical protein